MQAPSLTPPGAPKTAPVSTSPHISPSPPTKAAPYLPIPITAPTNRGENKRPFRSPFSRLHSHHYNTRYNTDTHLLAQSAILFAYYHHIANFSTELLTAMKQPSIKTLLKVPDASKWERGDANKRGRLLPNGVGNNRPPKEGIKDTGTIQSTC